MLDHSGSSEEGVKGIELGPKQQVALAALREGMNFARSADEAGVDRVTLYRWIQKDPQFKAAYNLWQLEIAEAARARLLRLTEKAVDVMEAHLDKGSEKAAATVLQFAMRKRSPQSTDPEVLGLKMELKEKRERRRAGKAMMNYLLAKTGMKPPDRRRFMNGTATPELQAEVDQSLQKAKQTAAGEDATSLQAEEHAPAIAPSPVMEHNLISDNGLQEPSTAHIAPQRAALRAAVARNVAHPQMALRNANVNGS